MVRTLANEKAKQIRSNLRRLSSGQVSGERARRLAGQTRAMVAEALSPLRPPRVITGQITLRLEWRRRESGEPMQSSEVWD